MFSVVSVSKKVLGLGKKVLVEVGYTVNHVKIDLIMKIVANVCVCLSACLCVCMYAYIYIYKVVAFMCVCVCLCVQPSYSPHHWTDHDQTWHDDGPPPRDGAHHFSRSRSRS